jgi:hypothetical protein
MLELELIDGRGRTLFLNRLELDEFDEKQKITWCPPPEFKMSDVRGIRAYITGKKPIAGKEYV